jgi:hypothetical protein
MTVHISHPRNGVTLSSYAAGLVPIAAALLVVAWRPWWLGFYHDDWWMVARGPDPTFFADFTDQASRPLYFLLISTLKQVLPPTTLPWHLLLAGLVIGNAVLIGHVGRRLATVMAAGPASAQWAGGLGAAIWLCCPWALGATAWVTPSVGQIAISLFCLAALTLLSDRPVRQKLALGGGLLALAYLINELFWLAFVPLLFVPAVRDLLHQGSSALRPLLLLLLGLLAVQALPIILNRGLVAYGVGINRSFNVQWLELALLSVRMVPMEIDRAILFPGAFWSLTGLLALAAVAGLVAALRAGRWREAAVALAGAVAIFTGCIGSLILFALAGYRLESLGVFSRTFITFSVWISWVPAVVLALAEGLLRWPQRAVVIVCIGLVGLMGASTIVRLRDWQMAWENQQAQLAALPVDRLEANARPGSFIVILLPERAGPVEGIEAFWDMTGAFVSRAPGLVARLADPEQRIFATAARLSKHRVVWDGSKMIMSWCPPQAGELWSLKAKTTLIVWDSVRQALSTFDRPVTFGCGIDPASAS